VSDLSIPWSVASSVAASLVGFAAAWGLLRGKVASLTESLAKVEASLLERIRRLESHDDEHAKALQAQAIEATATARRVSDISELKETAVRRDAFEDAMRELRIAVDRKASLPTMAATTAPRPRLPSRPDR